MSRYQDIMKLSTRAGEPIPGARARGEVAGSVRAFTPRASVKAPITGRHARTTVDLDRAPFSTGLGGENLDERTRNAPSFRRRLPARSPPSSLPRDLGRQQ